MKKLGIMLATAMLFMSVSTFAQNPTPAKAPAKKETKTEAKKEAKPVAKAPAEKTDTAKKAHTTMHKHHHAAAKKAEKPATGK